MTTPTGPIAPVAPKGGFQQGGWYNGQQYWNGTFSAPGVINSLSNQPGAGQAVNPAVVAASNITQGLKPGTNEAYLASQNGGVAPGTPGSPSGPILPTAPTATDALTGQISDIQKTINTRTEAYNKAMQDVADNPFYSQATLVGKQKQITDAYNRDLAPLNTQLKTYQTSQTAQTKADTDAKKVTVSVRDIGGVQTAVALDSQENIINKTPIGPSKVTKDDKTKLSATDKAVMLEGLKSDVKDGNTLQEIMDYYTAQGLDAATVYKTYNSKVGNAYLSPWGPSKETLQNVINKQYVTNGAVSGA